MRYANQGENATPPTPPDLSERDLQYYETIGNYENLQHDEVVVFKYTTSTKAGDVWTPGPTRVGILLNDATTYNMTDFRVYCATGATITVTHADGTVLTHLGTNAYHNFNHDYTGWTAFDTGEIVIDTDGGEGSYYFAELTTTVNGSENTINSAIEYIYMSDNIDIMPGSFLKANTAKKLILSNNITSFGADAMQNNKGLKYLLVPNGITDAYSTFFFSLTLDFLILNDVININVLFSNTISEILYLDFGNTASISSSCFENLINSSTIIFNTTTPPTISSSSFLNNLSKSAIIYVPLASLTAYKTNTNMTHLADQMVGY